MTKPYELIHTQKMTADQPTRHDVHYMDTHLPGLVGKTVGHITKERGSDQPWRAYWLVRNNRTDSLLIAEYYQKGAEGRALAAQAVINFCLPSHAPQPVLSHEEIMNQLPKSPSLARHNATVRHRRPNGKDIYEIDWQNPWMDNTRHSAPDASKTIHFNRDVWKATL